MAIKITKNVLALPICLGILFALAGCIADQPDVELESRTIAVEQNAIPTGAGDVSSVAHLLPETGPTYVTLTITEVDKNDTRKESEQSRRAITSGSGFVVDSSGYVMTAAHVGVAKGNTVSARAGNGRIYNGSVVDVNPANDMAVIKLRGYFGKAAFPSTRTCVPPGSLVYSLGKPHAQGDTARVGALQSMHYGKPVVYGPYGYPDAMVLRMSTQKGESGGPVFDGEGRLIGMVVSTLSDQTGQSINMAHAVYTSSLARFLCSAMSCSAEWARAAAQTPDGCS
jgi:S1-C subfamily serine protease